MNNLDNLFCEILHKMIELKYPKPRYKVNGNDYINNIAIYYLYKFNSNKISKISNIDDISFKDDYMKENRLNFLELINKTREIMKKEKFQTPYLEQEQFDKLIKKYNL